MKTEIKIKFQGGKTICKSFPARTLSYALRKCSKIASTAESVDIPISYVFISIL